MQFEDEDERVKPGITFWLACSIFAASVGSSLQFGYNNGVLNSPQQVIKDFMNETNNIERGDYLQDHTLTILWAITVAIFAVGGMVGGASAGWIGNKFGRKNAMLLNNIVAITGIALMFFCKMCKSLEMLIVGRFIIGINSGINTGVAPLYLSEIAPNSLRGASGTINQLAITVGILISQILGLEAILGTADLFPYVLGAAVIPAILQLMILPFCPGSPRYLYITKLDREKATNALVTLRGTALVEEELQEISNEASMVRTEPKISFRSLVANPVLRQPLVICVIIQLAQQLSGINAVIYYSTSIFKNALSGNEEYASYATLGIGAVNVIMTIVSAILVERAGRKTLLLWGLGGMFIFSLMLTGGLLLKNYGIDWGSYVCILAVICYVISFAIGPGSIPWFIVAEVFSQGARSAAISISVLVNWAANGTVGLVYPEFQKGLKEYNFVPFTVLLALFWVFIYYKVPETKGKTVEEMTEIFKRNTIQKKSITANTHYSEKQPLVTDDGNHD